MRQRRDDLPIRFHPLSNGAQANSTRRRDPPATVLGERSPFTPLSMGAARALDRRGRFDSLGDERTALFEGLEDAFGHVTVETIGSVAVCTA